MMYGWNDGTGIMMIFGGLLSLAFLIGIVFLIIWGVNQLNRRPTTSGGGDNALNLARERYARGEITQAQFEDIRRNLGG
jgi:putative membrane protein